MTRAAKTGAAKTAVDGAKAPAKRGDGRSTATKAAGSPRASAASPRTSAAPAPKAAKAPVLLSGGNPQIAKADGDAPVQAYIAAMPGWKRDVGRRLDALVARAVPGVKKAVRWNSPLYGVEGQGWFLSFHCFAKFVKVTFFRGTSLEPMPPGESKSKETRYLDVHEDDELDERQLARWFAAAAAIPGWNGGSPSQGGLSLDGENDDAGRASDRDGRASVRAGRESVRDGRESDRDSAAGKGAKPSRGRSAAELIDRKIASLDDWRGRTLARMRELILEADPDAVEEWKWMGTPVWSHDGILCTGETYRSVVKLTFAKGASLDDPARLFNSSLEGKARRAIDIRAGEEIDASAFKALVRRAVALNRATKAKAGKKAKD